MVLDRLIAALRRAADTASPSSAKSLVPQMGRAADGALEISLEITVKAPPETVYALLDPSAPQNRWTARGDQIEAVDRANGLYRLRDRRMPDEPFLMQIDKAEAMSAITIRTHGDGGQPIGALARSISHYAIVRAAGGSAVALVERAYFIDGLKPRDQEQHARMMAHAVSIDLNRLKAEAEAAAAVNHVAARA